MKASVVEIHKNYCIVFTADGRFIRKDMPAGAYEIGDEIIVDITALSDGFEKPLKKPFGIFAKLAAGFAAIVILGGGAFLGIKYAGFGFALSPVKVASEAAQAKIIDSTGKEDSEGSQGAADQSEQSLAAEAPAAESNSAGAQSEASSADAAKSVQSSPTSNGVGQSNEAQPSQDGSAATSDTNNDGGGGPALTPPSQVLFTGTFKLDKKNIDILIDYPDLNITYTVEQPYAQSSVPGEIETFILKIKNLQKSTFNGNIDIIFVDKDRSTLKESDRKMGNLGFDSVHTEFIEIAGNADSFKMTVYGSFSVP